MYQLDVLIILLKMTEEITIQAPPTKGLPELVEGVEAIAAILAVIAFLLMIRICIND